MPFSLAIYTLGMGAIGSKSSTNVMGVRVPSSCMDTSLGSSSGDVNVKLKMGNYGGGEIQ